MIFHLLNVSIYPQKYVDFLIRNKDRFDLRNHHFVLHTYGGKLFPNEILKEIKYSVTKNGWDVYRYIRFLKADDKIIVHYLGDPRHLLVFNMFPHLMKHVVWSIWGGDAYFPNYIKGSWKLYLYELLRHRIIPRIPLITCVVKGDYEFVISKYNSNALYLKSIYPSDVNDESFSSIYNRKIKNKCKRVLIGNSADPSNNHCEVIIALNKYGNEIDEIIVPLMYGGSKEYISSVVAMGMEYFGSKFKPLTEFMSSSVYASMLNSGMVHVFNHYRQQGLGNAFVMLALKKRIFIRGDVSSFEYFRDLGIQVQDTRTLLAGDAILFDDNPKLEQVNSEKILKETSEQHLVELWTKVFDTKLH
jgi:dTDP-N-acetylfucosamine:lipid II N-acetylfucosaminyltransferase